VWGAYEVSQNNMEAVLSYCGCSLQAWEGQYGLHTYSLHFLALVKTRAMNNSQCLHTLSTARV